jgi:Caspase domain
MMARLVRVVFLILANILLFSTTAQAQSTRVEKRVALVIGNGTYHTLSALPNPTSDVTLVGASLRRVGFEVTTLLEQDYASMNLALLSFRRRADAAGMNNLGTMLGNGRGIAENETEALRWYRAALAAGNTASLEFIDCLVARGNR